LTGSFIPVIFHHQVIAEFTTGVLPVIE